MKTSSYKSIDDTINDLKNVFNEFSNSNKEAYYNFMEYVDDIEEIANKVADNLNSIADDINDITDNLFNNDYSQTKNEYTRENNKENKNKNEVKKDKRKIKIHLKYLKEKINSVIDKSKLKLNEINDIIKDFDYASKKSYEDSSAELKNNLIYDFNNIGEAKSYNELIDFLEKFNKVIDYINNLYRSAYYTKHNKSSLAFLIDDEEEELNLIEKINIDDFKMEA